MAVTKGTGTTLLNGVTTSQTSAAVSASGDDVTEVYVTIVVVGTPTAAASVQVQVSPDGGTTYYSPATLLVSTPLAAGTYQFVLVLPPSATKFQVVFVAQIGGTSSTCTAQSNDVTQT